MPGPASSPKAPPQGESLAEVHQSLPPEVRAYLLQRSEAAHRAVLENMRSMTVDERIAYGRSLVHP